MTNRGRATPPRQNSGGGNQRKTTGSTLRSAVGRSAATTPQRKGINWNRVVLVLLLVGFIALITFPFWRRLIIYDPVESKFAALTAEQQKFLREQPGDIQNALYAIADNNPEQAVDMVLALQFAPTILNDTLPPSVTGQPFGEATFTRQDVLRGAEGKAYFYRVPDGALMRLEGINASNGPELHVYLSKEVNPTLATGVGVNFHDAGRLQGTRGNQNYLLAGIVPGNYESVVIYDVKYGEVYSAAPITFR